ncbi:flavodoxin domain-containing protein, partial [Peptostreptococcaceae bacterium OttesenSCG-928-C18]|nr:flavodoxin domain-containing protein [Peptostreptococcaceae bacterium OttesenSCG-928-C18]
YDTVIYGGGLYASGIHGLKKLKNYKIENLIIFTVGLSNPETTDYTEIITLNKRYIHSENIKFFHLRGEIDYSNLNFIDRLLMAMVKKVRIDKKKKTELTEEEKYMLDTYNKCVNFTNKESITPIINYIKNVE